MSSGGQFVAELAYIGIEVTDPAAVGGFFRECVGLVPGEPTSDGDAAWRNDGKARRIIVSEGPANDVSFIGLELADEDALDRVIARLRTAGYPTAVGTQARGAADLISIDAPWGKPIELAIGLADADEPFASQLVPGGFLTDGVGLGHVVVATTNFAESHHFLTEGLGMHQTDWVETEIAAGIPLEIRFYHLNERHHSIAVAKAPFALPKVLHHMMFEANDRDDVGRAFDRAWNQGRTIASGLGRHGNDEMFSFYVVSPAAFQVEIGHGGRRVTPDWDDNHRYDTISEWGHQPLTRPATVR